MDSEVERRLVHVSGAVIPLAYIVGIITWTQIRMIFVFGTLLALTLEILRLSSRLDWEIFETLTREYERENPAGYALYTISSTAVVLVFSPTVAIPAILMLMIADPVIGVFGSGEVGSVKPVPALLSMFGICVLLAFPFVPLIPAICGAIAATVADGVKPVIASYVIDDNLSIPPAAALAIIAGGQLVQHGYLPALGW
jgi:dolichol kinase